MRTLPELLAASEQSISNAETLFAPLTDAQLLWRPSAKVWGVADCVAHLVTSQAAYWPRIKGAFAKTREQNLRGSNEFKPRWLQRNFIEAVAPPIKRQMKTFKVFTPAESDVSPAIKQRFVDSQRELIAFMQDADGWDLNKHKLGSPVTPLLRFSVGEALWLTVVHTQRHLEQAKHVTENPAFPSA